MVTATTNPPLFLRAAPENHPYAQNNHMRVHYPRKQTKAFVIHVDKYPVDLPQRMQFNPTIQHRMAYSIIKC